MATRKRAPRALVERFELPAGKRPFVDPRSEVVRLPLTPIEHAELARRAADEGLPLEAYMRWVLFRRR